LGGVEPLTVFEIDSRICGAETGCDRGGHGCFFLLRRELAARGYNGPAMRTREIRQHIADAQKKKKAVEALPKTEIYGKKLGQQNVPDKNVL
jgi:hypothetical protein